MSPDANISMAVETESLDGALSLPCLLLQRFEDRTVSQPDALALEMDGRRLSYAQLNARANQVARVLSDNGVAPGNLVVLQLPASLDAIVAMLAVQKVGAAYVPVEVSWPAARAQQVVAQVQPHCIISDREDAVRLNDLNIPDYSVAELVAMAAEQNVPVDNLSVRVSSEDLCYVIYTSGTTGQPNGVMVTHGNIAGLFEGLGTDLCFDAQDKWLGLHSFSFGFSVWEIWGALSHGASLVLVDDELRKDPAAWIQSVARSAVSVVSLTPSALRQLLAVDSFPTEFMRNSVRLVVLSGEPVRHADLELWSELLGQHAPQLINTFALTETAGRVALKDCADRAEASVGLPAADVAAFVVNPDDLSEQQEGELLIAGPMVAAGYLRDPELTARRFIQLTTADGRSLRCYRTGDRFRKLPDGGLEFLGRLDTQIKLRGHRIELSDIEQVLRQHAHVKDAVVLSGQSVAGTDQLTAFIVPQSVAAEVQFWPSLGEHLLYDELLYDFMAADEVRVASYQQAFANSVQNKVVLDIGTGRHAVLARMCVAAGARKVYAVEVLKEAADAARTLIEGLGLGAHIEVICADMLTLQLPEPVDVCTQGVVGNIGSSDGIVPLWNAAREYFQEEFIAVPERCVTLIAPGELPSDVARDPAFTKIAADYLGRLFTERGQKFDARLCVRNYPANQLLASEAEFEVLDFSAVLADEYTGQATFTVSRAGRFDGFLLWTRLENAAVPAVDFLENQQAWLPVWLPVPAEGIPVVCGDSMVVTWTCKPAEGSIFPDYAMQVTLVGEGGNFHELNFNSPHRSDEFGSTALHRALYQNAPHELTADSATDLQAWLGTRLPAHMIPLQWQILDQLPLNANAKLDRNRLLLLADAASTADMTETSGGEAGDQLEADVAAIWSEVLGRAVAVNEDFFSAGGDSVLAVRLTTEIQRYLDDTVFLAALFDAPTVALYAEWLHEHHAPAIAKRAERNGDWEEGEL